MKMLSGNLSRGCLEKITARGVDEIQPVCTCFSDLPSDFPSRMVNVERRKMETLIRKRAFSFETCFFEQHEIQIVQLEVKGKVGGKQMQ